MKLSKLIIEELGYGIDICDGNLKAVKASERDLIKEYKEEREQLKAVLQAGTIESLADNPLAIDRLQNMLDIGNDNHESHPCPEWRRYITELQRTITLATREID